MLVKINVTRPIAVPSLSAGQRSTDLAKGVHEVDDSILEHWFVKACIARGVVTEIVKKGSQASVAEQPQEEKPVVDDIIKENVHVDGERFSIGTVVINELLPKTDKIVLKTEVAAAERAANPETQTAEGPLRRRRQ